MPLSAGAKLGPYEILAPIGAGGMGEVYKARDPRLDRTVPMRSCASSCGPAPLKASEEQDPAVRDVKASLRYRASELVSNGTKRKLLHVAKKQGSTLIQG